MHLHATKKGREDACETQSDTGLSVKDTCGIRNRSVHHQAGKCSETKSENPLKYFCRALPLVTLRANSFWPISAPLIMAKRQRSNAIQILLADQIKSQPKADYIPMLISANV